MSDGPSIATFFDSISDEYAACIRRCVPRYDEMLSVLLSYLPQDRNYQRILDLGCGTGNLSVTVHEQFPDSKLTLVDVSPESLQTCRERFAGRCQIELLCEDFRRLRFRANSFDLVVLSIAIHHLEATGKQQLFAAVCDWLAPAGVFSFVDQCRGSTDDLYRKYIQHWRQLALAGGATPAEWQMWMEHQQAHDHHDPLHIQLQWLRKAGFEVATTHGSRDEQAA
jgi:tRNA (cmo5U34)-methyltransferase